MKKQQILTCLKLTIRLDYIVYWKFFKDQQQKSRNLRNIHRIKYYPDLNYLHVNLSKALF